MAVKISLKQIKINKASSVMITVASIAIFVTFFALASSKDLLGRLNYQNRAINVKQTALKQLQQDVSATQKLTTAYKQFVNTNQNLIGGSSTGTGPNDGNNAQLVLDALPSQYDFPALVTSLQNLLSSQGVSIDGITGTDEQASISSNGTLSNTNGASATTVTSAVGNTVAMPFQVNVDGPYANIQNLIAAFQRSIRPLQIQTMQLSGDESDMTVNISAQTYYQPGVTFTISKKAVN